MTTISNVIGAALWLKDKADSLEKAWEFYQATGSESAFLECATIIAEVTAGLAAGLAVEGIIETFQASGLDRVFDSMRGNKSFTEYLKSQSTTRAAGSYIAGQATDGLIGYLREYVAENGTLDPVFSYVYHLLEDEPDLKTSTFTYDDENGTVTITEYDKWGNVIGQYTKPTGSGGSGGTSSPTEPPSPGTPPLTLPDPDVDPPYVSDPIDPISPPDIPDVSPIGPIDTGDTGDTGGGGGGYGGDWDGDDEYGNLRTTIPIANEAVTTSATQQSVLLADQSLSSLISAMAAMKSASEIEAVTGPRTPASVLPVLTSNDL